MIWIRSNKGGVIHMVENWEELPGIAERIEALRPKYFGEESFPVLASSSLVSFAVVLADKKEEEL